MKNPAFVVFEGLDACGKSTISKQFAKRNQFELLGALPSSIKSWLPTIGELQKPEATFSYFTLCNLLKAVEINDLLAQGRSVALDRFYYTSFVYHQKLLNGGIPNEMKKVYRFTGLPKPDLVVFLDVPQEIRKQRIKERGEKLQWYGDAVSVKTDLTPAYFELFRELDLPVLRVDNHTNSVEQSLMLIESAYRNL